MTLLGGASNSDAYYGPDELDMADAARANAEVLEQHAANSTRPRSRWSEVRDPDTGELVWVEVERLDPLS